MDNVPLSETIRHSRAQVCSFLSEVTDASSDVNSPASSARLHAAHLAQGGRTPTSGRLISYRSHLSRESHSMMLATETLTGPEHVRRAVLCCLLTVAPLTSNEAKDAAHCAQVTFHLHCFTSSNESESMLGEFLMLSCNLICMDAI